MPTIIKLTKNNGEHHVFVNMDNVTVFQKRSDKLPTEIYFISEDEEFNVKETPDEIIEKIKTESY